MSVDDPDKKPLNQTRFGVATGHANERQMLDSRADTFGIRTIIKQNSDGSETMCRTHAGMPRFITNEVPKEEEPLPSPMFLETGHTQYPTARTINQYYGVGSGQGQWWFKVATNALWLGYISSVTGTQSDADNRKFFNKFGGATPPSGATLYDGMISPATSVTKTPSATLIDAMIAKRAAMVSCPASMFSGKMRLFMQARYGALLDTTQVGGYFRIEGVGNTVRVDSVLLANLGNLGAGLFTTSDKRYFIIKAAGTSVQVIPLKARSGYAKAVSDLQAVIQSGAIGTDLEKAEAYIFAHMELDYANTITYSGQLPDINPLCYSWNFKWDGSVADVISVGYGGAGIDSYFISTHYRLTITHSVSGSTDNWSFAYSTISTENWIDGRGTDHIFLPDYGTGGRMVLYTMGLGFNHFACTGKLHCFYKKDGELVVSSYNRGTQSTTPAWYETNADWPGSTSQDGYAYVGNAIVKGRRWANYKLFNATTEHGGESFTVGASTYGGSFRTGSMVNVDIGHGLGCAAPPQYRYLAITVTSLEGYTLSKPVDGWNGVYCSAFTNDTYTEKAYWLRYNHENLGRIRDVYESTKTRAFQTFVIPFFDCSAVFVYEMDEQGSGVVSVTRQHQTCYNWSQGSQSITNVHYAPPPGGGAAGDPEGPVQCEMPDFIGNDYYQDHHDTWSTETFTKDLGPPRFTLNIHHFHGALTVTPTEDASVLSDFVYVDNAYPYVDLQVWTSVNAGGTSAQMPVYNPDSTRRWTGWV